MQNNSNIKYNTLKNSLGKTIKQVYATLHNLKSINSKLASLANDNAKNNIPNARRKINKHTLKRKTVGFTNSEGQALHTSRYIPTRESSEYEQEQSEINSEIIANVAKRYNTSNKYYNALAAANANASASIGKPVYSRNERYNYINNAVGTKIDDDKTKKNITRRD